MSAAVTTETALLQRIEEMSFLGAVNERLARVPDFASACRALSILNCSDDSHFAICIILYSTK